MKVGKFAKHVDHAPVIFQSVQAGPWKDVAPAFGIAVLRLMHVPQDNKMDPLHFSCRSRANSMTGVCPAGR